MAIVIMIAVISFRNSIGNNLVLRIMAYINRYTMFPINTAIMFIVIFFFPISDSPMIRHANPVTTIPVPEFISDDFCSCPIKPPAKAVRQLAKASPTIVVNLGSIDDEDTMSELSRVALIDNPNLVLRNNDNNIVIIMNSIAGSIMFEYGIFINVNTVSCLINDTFDE